MLTVAVLVSTLSLVVALGTMADAVMDLRTIQRAGITNGRRTYARAQLRREGLRLVVLAGLAGFAFDAWLHLEAVSGWGRRMVAVFIVIQVLTTANTVLDLTLNVRVRRWLTRH